MNLRSSGSGNIGAANVARAAGAHLGALTLVLDVAKGLLPVALARVHGCGAWMIVAVGLCAFFGHIFPVFNGFRGGKGVATAAGIFLVFSPPTLVAALVAYSAAMALRRIASLASLSAATVLPVAAFVADGAGPTVFAALVVSVTLFLTHRDNLRRLASGTEPPFRPR